MSRERYEDVLYEEKDGVATVTVNRPEALNAFRPGTYAEVADAIRRAGWNREIGVIVLTGAGSRAFGVGGDGLVSARLEVGCHTGDARRL